jgi:hypothetical protein
MHKLFVALLCLLPCINIAQAQPTDLSVTLAQLRQSDLFRECADFKTNIETQTRQAAMMPGLTPDGRNQLRVAYTGVYEKYDAFLKAVKQDLVNPQRTQAVTQNPNAEATQYAGLYAAVKAEYDNQYTPVLQRLSGGGKGILDDLKAMARTTFTQLASQVLTNVTTRVQQKLTLNSMLPMVNEQFYNPMRMKLWSELDIPETVSTASTTPTGDNPALQPGNPTTYQPMPEVQQQEVVIPAPTVSSMAGSVEFVQLVSGQEQPMSFEQRTGKDIEVVTDEPTDVVVKDQSFSTAQSYPIGTKFRMKIQNDAFTYVLVLNSDGVKLLHPRVQTRSAGKDIEVTQEATPSVGNVVIPANGTFTITPSKTGNESPTDDMALLLSKSELVVEEIMEKLNAVSGSLSERMGQVFGADQIRPADAGVRAEGNRFTFNAGNSPQNVLPLVFRIRK